MDNVQDQANLLRQVRLALQNEDFIGALGGLNGLIAAAETREDWGAAARHLGNLALTYYRTSNPVRAVESFVQGIQYARKDGDQATETGLLGNMGNILREMRLYDEAIKCLNEALLISQSLGDLRGRGIWLANLGLVYDDLKQPAEAADYHEDAVDIARQLQDRTNLAARLGNLGNSLIANGALDDALLAFSESVEIYKAIGRNQDAALRMGIMGNLYAQRGRNTSDRLSAIPYFASALENYQNAALIARDLHDFASEAELLRSMGHVLLDLGQVNDARQYLQAAAHYFTQLNLPHKLAEVNELLESSCNGWDYELS
jgi:tetratricopeptide (TPR) repeat protein